MADYSDVSYWDSRYSRDAETFEWYCSYASIEEQLQRSLHQHQRPRVLVAGNGSSKLAYDVSAKLSVDCVDAVDFSNVITKHMESTHSNTGCGLKYVTGDLRRLECKEASYELIIDKATCDSILCAENGEEDIALVLQNISNCLVDNGVFFMISHAAVNMREQFLNLPKYKFNIDSVDCIDKPSTGPTDIIKHRTERQVYYCYTVIKQP
jgi:SAM-dependent methyltransferase